MLQTTRLLPRVVSLFSFGFGVSDVVGQFSRVCRSESEAVSIFRMVRGLALLQVGVICW